MTQIKQGNVVECGAERDVYYLVQSVRRGRAELRLIRSLERKELSPWIVQTPTTRLYPVTLAKGQKTGWIKRAREERVKCLASS